MIEIQKWEKNSKKTDFYHEWLNIWAYPKELTVISSITVNIMSFKVEATVAYPGPKHNEQVFIADLKIARRNLIYGVVVNNLAGDHGNDNGYRAKS